MEGIFIWVRKIKEECLVEKVDLTLKKNYTGPYAGMRTGEKGKEFQVRINFLPNRDAGHSSSHCRNHRLPNRL